MPKIATGSKGNIEIRHVENRDGYFLYADGIQWMATSLDFLHAKDTLYSQFDLAYGDVLLTGLGFGILAKALTQKEEVTSVTVVELNKDVIDQYISVNGSDEKIIIINDNASTYTSDHKYDCLLPDHYETQNIDWKISDMNLLASRVRHDVFWPWSIEDIFLREHYPVKYHQESPEEFLEIYSKDFYKLWLSFIEDKFSSHDTLMGISEQKLIEYLSKYIKYLYKK
jgi:hypothetical protein